MDVQRRREANTGFCRRESRAREKQNGRQNTQKVYKCTKDVKWIDQTQECDEGQTLVSTVMDLRNPLNTCIFSKG